MGLHRDVENLFGSFMTKNFAPKQHTPTVNSIVTMQGYTIRRLIRMIGDPDSYSNKKDIIKWGDKFKKKNESLYEWLSNPKSIEELKKVLKDQEQDIYRHPYFQELIDQGKVAWVKTLQDAFKKATNSVVGALERRAAGLQSYNDIPQNVKQSLSPPKNYTTVLKPYFELGSLGLQKKIIKLLKAPTDEKLKNFKAGADTDSKKIKMEMQLSNILKNIELLPLPLQQVIQATSDSEMLGTLRVLFNDYSEKRAAGSTLNEMYIALKPLRGRVEEVYKEHAWVNQELKNIDKPHHIRNPQYLITKMEELVRTKDSKGLIALVNKYVNNKNVNKMTQGLNEISPALAQIFFFARTNPSQLKLGARVGLYTQERNKEAMDSFKADTSQITDAILNPAKLKILESKGFNLQKFLRENKLNRATKLLYDLQANVLTSLMEDKNSLLSKLRDSEELKDWFRSKGPKLLKMDRLDREALIKGTVLHISKGLLNDSKDALAANVRVYYGNAIQNALGDSFYEGFISKTVNTYYSNSVMSYLRATIVREIIFEYQGEKKSVLLAGVNPSEMGFKGMGGTFRRIQKLRVPGSAASTVKTVSDLELALGAELKNLKNNNGFGSRIVSNLILDISETTGRYYLENKLLIDKIKDIANSHETDIDLYVTSRKNGMRTRGGSGDTHPTETQHDRIKSHEEHVVIDKAFASYPSWHPLRIKKDKFIKDNKGFEGSIQDFEKLWLQYCKKENIDLKRVARKGFEAKNKPDDTDSSATKRKREFDPLRQKREDEAKQKRLTLDLLKQNNPRLERLIRSAKSTRAKTGIEQDPALRAVLKNLYDQSVAAGLSGDALNKTVERQYKKFLSSYSAIVYETVGKDPEFKKAARMAKIQSLANRYDEMKGMFTLQGELGDSKRTKTRTNSIVSEMNQEAERKEKGLDGPGMGINPLVGQYDEAVARSGRKGGNTEGYIFKHSYSSIPYMIEQAKTPEELTEVRNFINDIIPMKHLRSVERITAPEYTVYDESDETKKPLKFNSLTTFMSHHEERILKSRADERDGILKTGAQPI